MINNKTNIMIDLETMDISTHAAMLSIGAAAFNFTDGIMDKFYINVDLQSCIDKGMTVNGKTVMWWLAQSKEAREVLQDELENRSLTKCLNKLTSFIKGCSDDGDGVIVWGNGVDFDNTILTHAYKICNLSLPWNFRNNMCYRTVKNMYPEIAVSRSGITHTALDDAITQANHLIAISDFI